jgi:prepilin-type N-terminal cleavage/methylation domain-containing protein
MDYKIDTRQRNSWRGNEPAAAAAFRQERKTHDPARGTSLAMTVTDMIASPGRRRGFSIVELLIVLAVSTVLMAVGTPILRGALAEQRLRAGSSALGNALSEARREAFRTSTTARVEVDPADGRISVFATDTTLMPPTEVERKRYYLPQGVLFTNVNAVTSFTFDTLGRPAVLPMTLQVGIANTQTVRTVSVLGTGQTTGI